MVRTFNGRQSEELYNQELYKLFEVVKNIIDVPLDPSVGPETTREGALWLDRQNGGELKYFDEGTWNLLFGEKFRMVGEILSPAEPVNPVPGQLWLRDGVMMYYSGSEWLPVKSVNVDTEFNISSFEQFLMINPIPVSGNQTVSYEDTDGDGTPEAVYKSQFLMPSVDLDKFFVNGTFTNEYERVSNVAIQYPSDKLQGKVASAVHINPSKLVGITKKLVMVDKLNPIIAVSELHTEYYGLKGGVGHLLLKTNDSTAEYISVPQGIQLSPAAAALYDYVLAITYKFKEAKQEGALRKGTISLSGTNSVYIGTVTDPFNVFVQGMYLDEDSENYTYDSSNGYLKLDLETRMDVGVIAFPKKEKGSISTVDAQNRGIITMSGTYTKPIVFVYGETLRGIADYIRGTDVDSNKLYVIDAIPGMKYAIVETMGNLEDAQLYVKDGVSAGNTIPCTFDELPGDINPILFLNGILVSQRDITRSADGNITCEGMIAGMDYVLLKDPAKRLIFNDIVSFTTVPTEPMDDAIVYIENQLVCDSSAVYTTKLPTIGTIGEVKLLIQNGTEQWYKYAPNGWVPIVSPEEITSLNSTALAYTTSRRTISVLQNFGEVNCSYFGYTFANSIEEPLLRGEIMTNDTDTEYRVAFNHSFPTGTNSLSVWLNGIKQYPNTSQDIAVPNGIIEVNSSRFKLCEPIAGNLFYVIERPELSETKTCQRQVLTIDDRVAGAINVYQTAIPLFPGNVRVFIGGLRQPSSVYKIIDPYTIMLNETVIGSANNYPIETIEIDGRVINIPHTVYDKILIEVRQDFNLREITLPIRYPGQNSWTTAGANLADPRLGGDGLPKAILDSKDFIMIYINGLAYGKEYIIDKDKEAITLTNSDVTSKLGVDLLDRYFKSNPEAYLDWQKRHNYADYIPKPITDKVTFEWR